MWAHPGRRTTAAETSPYWRRQWSTTRKSCIGWGGSVPSGTHDRRLPSASGANRVVGSHTPASGS
jgi:hypothetical protein